MTKPASFAIISLLTGIVATAASTQIAAADIVYDVDQTIGATGSVTGTITTDGTLSPAFFANFDITDFNLTITVNGQSSNLRLGVNGGAFFVSSGADITATPSELLFNVAAGQFANFFTNPTTTVCAPAWTVRGAGGALCGMSGSVNAAIAVPGGPIASVPVSGTVTLGVPGPIVGAGLPGLIAALGGLVAMTRRRRKQLP